jgi:hypothetical protein
VRHMTDGQTTQFAYLFRIAGTFISIPSATTVNVVALNQLKATTDAKGESKSLYFIQRRKYVPCLEDVR